MGKLKLEITDSSFNQKMSIEYELLVHLTPLQITYLIHDSRMNVLIMKSFDFDTQNNMSARIREVYIEDKNLSLTYKRIRVAADSKVYTLIPEALYKPEDEIACLSQVTVLKEDQYIFSNLVLKTGIRNIAALDKSIASSLSSFFGGHWLYHSLTPLISGYRYIAQNKSGKQLFVNLHPTVAQIVLFDGKDLIFTNQFDFQTAQDLLYYLMLVFDQFNLDQEEVPVLISGFLLIDSEIYQAMYKYIRHIDFVHTPAHLHFPEPFRSLDHHFYFDLYSLTLCE